MGVEEYKVIRSVGKGSFGKVYLVRHTKEKKHYCMKCIKLTNIPKKEREACRHEVKLMQRLSHPNIVGFKDSFFAKRGNQLCIVMTYCDGGDLSDRVKQQSRTGRRFREDQVLNWFVQISLGLHAMHENNILHRDLKTQNIFLLGNGRLVLGDLGISKVLEGTMDFAKTCIGTPYYMSPELFKNQPYNHKSDIWALGCILYELCTLKHAFDANSLNGLSSKILRGYYPPVDKKFSSGTRELIKKMLSKHPSSRPSIHETLRNPKIKKHIANFMSDIVSRPKNNIGDGTMVVRRAVMKVAGNNLGQTMSRLDSNAARDAQSLIAQLKSLGLDSVVRKAIKTGNEIMEDDDSRSVPSGRENENKQLRVRGAKPPRSRRQEEKKRQERERLAALRREEERKRAVKAALGKLRKEREQRLAVKRRAEDRKHRMAGNRYGLGGGGAGAARAARQRYHRAKKAPSQPRDRPRGPVRAGPTAGMPRSKDDMLAIARERSKQLEGERRKRLADDARRNQEQAERRAKDRQERYRAVRRDEREGKCKDVSDDQQGVRELDNWDARQKAQRERFNERRKKEKALAAKRKKGEEDRLRGLKMKWKEENDRMGRMLEEAKKKREAKLLVEKEEREAERKREKQLREAEKKRQEEMALAVKKAKERREAEKEVERRAQQSKDEGIQARRRMVEQQRRNRMAAQTAAVQSTNDAKSVVAAKKPQTQPVQDKRRALQGNDRRELSRNEAWSSKQEEQDEMQGNKKGAKGAVIRSVFPSRRNRARTPSPPPSPAAVQARRDTNSRGYGEDDSKAVLSTRDQVLARKRERQRAKDEETRRQLAAAREDVLRDRQRAKEKAIEQRMTSGSAVKPALKKIQSLTPSPSQPLFSPSPKKPTEIEELADEAMRRHGDLAIAAEMPGSKYSDEDEENDADESVIIEDIMANTRLHEDHPIFDDSDDMEINESLEEDDDIGTDEVTDATDEQHDHDDDEEAFQDREEELKEELKMATQRCNTLRKTLLQSRGGERPIRGLDRPISEEHESKYDEIPIASPSPSKVTALKTSDERIDSPYGYEVDAFEIYSDDYSESSDDEGGDLDENPQSAINDNVPPPSNYVGKIQLRRENIRDRCMGILGDVRFEAAFGVVQERYRRCERGEDGVEEDEAVFAIAMQNLLGPNYQQLYQDLEQLVLIEEGYM